MFISYASIASLVGLGKSLSHEISVKSFNLFIAQDEWTKICVHDGKSFCPQAGLVLFVDTDSCKFGM